MKNVIRMIVVACFAFIPSLTEAQAVEGRIVDKEAHRLIPLEKYSNTDFVREQMIRAADPGIVAMVEAINEDSLRATLVEMGAWGSRFLMNDNNKEIATSLMNRFLSYGYTDVKLDSFYLWINWAGLVDSAWQYNVVCTLPGKSAPKEVYVIGGHWDSICFPDPFTDAPGVNDNGTAVAATLEIARVFKQFGYQPEATIQFTLFAAEELGLFGSRVAASKARFGGEDIRYMLNLDMISNNPDNLEQVKVYQYPGYEWASILAADATERYTSLEALVPSNFLATASDSYPYFMMEFPTAYFEEIAFSPNWHKPSDTLGNCNVPYLTKITGAALATIAEQQLVPYPQRLSAHSTSQDIVLNWQPTDNDFVKGFNVYRSENEEGQYQKISPVPVDDSTWRDITVLPNRQYYYMITTVNDSLKESMFSNVASGARYNFCDTLLVLSNVKGTNVTPDSVRNFYKAALDTIPFVWKDINATQKVSLAKFSRYRNILWMTNSLEYEMLNSEMTQGLNEFSENGGNILFAGFSPGRFWMNANLSYPLKVAESSLLQQLFKIDTIDRKAQSMLFRANSVAPDYDTLTIDTLKYLDPDYPGQVYMVDVFTPLPEADVIYRFDSKFDSTNVLGKMKNRPVGIEYMGEDFKSILLSFPLYYLDTTDARDFLKYVMTQKFRSTVGISQIANTNSSDLLVFPNPVKDVINISFKLEEPGHVRLMLVSLQGTLVTTWIDRSMEQGVANYRFSTKALAPGFYQLVLETEKCVDTRKMIRVR